MLGCLSQSALNPSTIPHNEREAEHRTEIAPGASLLMRFLNNHKGAILVLGSTALVGAWIAGSIALGVFSLGVTVPYSVHLSLGLFALGAALFGISAYRAKSDSFRGEERAEKIIRRPRGKRRATMYFMRPTHFRKVRNRLSP